MIRQRHHVLCANKQTSGSPLLGRKGSFNVYHGVWDVGLIHRPETDRKRKKKKEAKMDGQFYLPTHTYTRRISVKHWLCCTK